MLLNSEHGGIILYKFTWKGHSAFFDKDNQKKKIGEQVGEVANAAKGPS